MVNIVIGGDLCPSGNNLPYFIRGDAGAIFTDLLDEFRKADLSLVNLECPLIERPSPIRKNGPTLGVAWECINGIRRAGISLLNLANNHIMDHGAEGLSHTLKTCRDAQIPTVGAGGSLEEAGRLFISKVGDLRLGIMAVAEHEFSIAKKAYWGANPFDLVRMLRVLQARRSDFDYLIVLVHGGNEHYPLPSPRLRDTCHFLAESGADAVIVQHTHCPGCFEEYLGSFIVYGQGNLIFDKKTPPSSSWNEGFLVKLQVEEKGRHSMKLVPHMQSTGTAGVRRMSENSGISFLKAIHDRSERLSDASYIEKEWLSWCNSRKNLYYFGLFPGVVNNRILTLINRHFPFIEKLYSDRHLLRLENMLRCESHREVLETLLEQRRGHDHIS